MSTTPSFTAPGKGPWELDSTHFPRPASRFLARDYPDAMVRGFSQGTARYGLLLDHIAVKIVNGWIYTQPAPYLAPPGAMKPPPAPVLWLLTRLHPKMRARIATSERAFANKQWRTDLDTWDNVDKPNAIKAHLAIQNVDVAALSDQELAQHLENARAHMANMAELHHKYTATAIVCTGDFLVSGMEWTGASAGALLELIGGTSPISVGFAAAELDTAGEAITNSATATAVFSSGLAPQEALGQLAQDPQAGAAVTAYLDAVRYRSVGYDVTDPTAGELPGQLLAALSKAAQGRARHRQPDDPTMLRDRVPAQHQADFDSRLAETRLVNRIRDERGQYSDGWGTGLARHAILEVGKRLVARGLLHSVQHAPDLTAEELTSLLLTGTGPSADEAAAHFTYRTTASVTDAPPFLNAMPAPPPSPSLLPPAARRSSIAAAAVIAQLFSSSEKPNEETVLHGLPVSPGTYVGTARVVDSPEDFHRIQQGDVLVTRSTSPYFNVILPLLGAIVTDRGGQLSHAAIVAREYGIPGVVGTREGTTKIADGCTVEVDSNVGEVRVLSGKTLVK